MTERIKWFKQYFKKGEGEADPRFETYQMVLHDRALNRACQMLGIDQEEVEQVARPIILLQPDQFDLGEEIRYKLVTKEDGTTEVIYDQALITIILFGEHTLMYYQANINYAYDLIVDDIAGEVNYFDIVNIETSFQYDSLEDIEFEILDLDIWLTDGSLIPLRLRHRLFTKLQKDILLTDEEQMIIRHLKEVINSKMVIADE